MNQFTKSVILPTAIFAIALFLGSYLINKGITEEQDRYRAHIGEEFILMNDTLTVVNYSIWNKEFILNNGVRVEASMILQE